MEFIMNTDLATALPSEISFNFEELEAELAERLAYYNALVVTEDTIKESKAERATLNKLREAVETKRKEVKKQVNATIAPFEAKVKRLVAMIDEPIQAIDTQLKSYEEQRREEKRQEIEAAYDAIVNSAIRVFIPLDRIFDPKWLNATVTIKKVEEDIRAASKKIQSDMLALATVEPEYQASVRAKYIETLDVSAAIAHLAALKTAQERFEALEVSEPTPAQETPAEATVAPAAQVSQQPQESATTTHAEKLYSLRLEFHLTMDQANALKSFLAQQGISYTKI